MTTIKTQTACFSGYGANAEQVADEQYAKIADCFPLTNEVALDSEAFLT